MRAPRASANSFYCPSCLKEDWCNECSDGSICFDVTEKHGISGSAEQQVMHIFVFGLECGQELEVQREFKDECDPLWEPWMTCGRPTVITKDCPEVILVVPGRYRIHTEHVEPELDPEHVRIQATKIGVEFAKLRLQQQCCC